MITHLLYLLAGVMIGVLVKYEFDLRGKKKRLQKRIVYLKHVQCDSLQKQDAMLESLRGMNRGMQTSGGKEVR